MDTQIYYKVEGSYYRRKRDQKSIITISETFEDPNPILAREKAISYYQNIIDNLIQGASEKNSNNKRTLDDVKDFFVSGRKHKFFPDFVDVDGTSLSIYLVQKMLVPFKNPLGIIDYQEDKRKIHYVDYNSQEWDAYNLKCLIFESSLYFENGYDYESCLLTQYKFEDCKKIRDVRHELRLKKFKDDFPFI